MPRIAWFVIYLIFAVFLGGMLYDFVIRTKDIWQFSIGMKVIVVFCTCAFVGFLSCGAVIFVRKWD